MKQTKKWLQAVECFVVLFGVVLSAYGEATTVNVTVGLNADEGIGYGPYEGAEVLTLNITPQTWYKIVSSECTDNTGDNIWYRESASDVLHKWVTFGVLPNFDPTPLESHAAKFQGTLSRVTSGAGGTGSGGTMPFDVKVSDADADVDALGRHEGTTWPPTDPEEGPLNDLEDNTEAGASGGLAMPVTDAVETLPTTRPANSGKALQVRINAKKAGSLDFTGQGTKLAVYRQSGEEPHTQTKVTSAIGITISGLTEVFYLHTCTDFAAVTLATEFTPTEATDKSKDQVRVYPLTNGYQVYVNTPVTTDDYVPVETNGRVPITVFREPSTAPKDLRLKDATTANHVKFYAAKTGGTGTETKDFTMAQDASSITFYVSGSTTGTGDRDIKLYEKNGEGAYVEKKSLDVTVVNVTLAVTGATKITAVLGNSKIDHFATPKGGAADKVTLIATIIPNTEAIRSVLDWVTATEDGANPLQATVPKKDARGFPVQVTIGGSEMKEARVWVIWAIGVAQKTAGPAVLHGMVTDQHIPPQRGTGVSVPTAWNFTFTISPISMLEATDRPDFTGFKSVQVPDADAVNITSGDILAAGGMWKWDVSRRIRVRILSATVGTVWYDDPGGAIYDNLPNANRIQESYPANTVTGNDDTVTDGENNVPNANGQVTCIDTPNGPVLRNAGGNIGDTVEDRAQYGEFLRLEIQGTWVRVSDFVNWRHHGRLKKASEAADNKDYNNDGDKIDILWIDNGSVSDTTNNGW